MSEHDEILKIKLKSVINSMTNKEIRDYLIDLAILEYGDLAGQVEFGAVIDTAIEECGGYDSLRKFLIERI